MAAHGMESRLAGPLPLLLQVSTAMGLVQVIDEMVPWDPARCRVSPGRRIEALVLNILAGRSPLYRVAQFYEDTATGLLFGNEVRPEHLTDDSLARALDKLAEVGARRVYSAVALRACLLEDIERDFLHFDTTSISLYGEYPDDPPGQLQLTHGYSKDNHPELKQLVLGVLGNREGIPIWSDARDGNSEDSKANLDAIDQFCAALSPAQLRETVYVADSKLVTGPNLQRMVDLPLWFLSHLPESFAAARQAKEAAVDDGHWDDLGPLAKAPRPHAARYRANEQHGIIDGRKYRLVVIHSDHLEARKRETFTKDLARKRAALEKELAALGKRRFESLEAAGEAAGPLVARAEGGLIPLKLTVVEQRRRVSPGQRGRPRKEAPMREAAEFVLVGEIGQPDPARVAREESLLGLFVLITNLEDREAFPARRLLEEYRDQSTVEQRFAFLKDPVFIDGLYLHTPRRIEALAYVFVMACLVYSVFERRVRRQLQAQRQRILLPGKRWSDNPTGKMLLALVGNLVVCRSGAGPWELCSPPHMTQRAAQVAALAGFDLEAIYRSPP